MPNDQSPLPSSTKHDVLNKSQASVVTFRPGHVSPFKSQRTCLRGNTVTPTPEITVYHDCSGTPESVKLRMRFDLDWTSTYSGSPSRRRHNSFDERVSHVDPLTPRAQSIRKFTYKYFNKSIKTLNIDQAIVAPPKRLRALQLCMTSLISKPSNTPIRCLEFKRREFLPTLYMPIPPRFLGPMIYCLSPSLAILYLTRNQGLLICSNVMKN